MTAGRTGPTAGFYRRRGKRILDVVVAGTALVVTAPLAAAVAVAVRRRLGSPVLFTQARPGRHGEPFDLVKFRSMRDARGPDGAPLPDDQRLGSFGRALRASSLDELPELVNVLRGDMSLVGPRPLLMDYLGRYDDHQARRHEVRPGITGWAQVNGRNATDWPARFDLDVWYVDHVGLALDCRILWRTLRAVLRRDGITADGHATMPPFPGTAADEPQDRSDGQGGLADEAAGLADEGRGHHDGAQGHLAEQPEFDAPQA